MLETQFDKKNICAKSYFNICVFIFPLWPWETEFGRITFLWKSKLMICFHPEYFDIKNFLRHRKRKEISLQGVKGKILLLVKRLTGFSDTRLLSFNSISCEPHLGERKNPPENIQKKNPTHNYIWVDDLITLITKWISVLCSTNIPTDPPSAHSFSL